MIFSFAENLTCVFCFVAASCFQIINLNIKLNIHKIFTKSPLLLHADVVVEWSITYIVYCGILTGSPDRKFRLSKVLFPKKTNIWSALLKLGCLCFWQVVAESKNTRTLKPAGRCIISAVSQEHGHITESGWALFLFSSVQCFYKDHLPSGIKRLRNTGINLEVYV